MHFQGGLSFDTDNMITKKPTGAVKSARKPVIKSARKSVRKNDRKQARKPVRRPGGQPVRKPGNIAEGTVVQLKLDPDLRRMLQITARMVCCSVENLIITVLVGYFDRLQDPNA